MSDKRLNEGFRPYTDSQPATDPKPFIEAAEMIEAGMPIDAAWEILTPQHRTSVFHVEQRPGLPMLLDKGKDAAKILRKLAEDLPDGDS